MLDADPRKRKKAPHHQTVEEARDRPLTYNARLQHHFGKRSPQPAAGVIDGQSRSGSPNRPEALPQNPEKIPDTQA